MEAKRKIYIEPHDRTRRLAELGLREEWLQQAIDTGQLQRMSCTPHHPAPYAGLSAWAETIRALRDTLIPEAWKSRNPHGLPIVVSPKGDLSITVATGDEATGREEIEPCTKSPKGPTTKSLIFVNQYKLFPDDECIKAFTSSERNSLTWLLLIHSDPQSREVRAELSLPVGMNLEGRVDGWEERIILGSTPFDSDALEIPIDDIPQTPNININLKRRA